MGHGWGRTWGLQCPPLVVQSHGCPWDSYGTQDGKGHEIAVPPISGTIPWVSLGLLWDMGGKGHGDCIVSLQ